MDTLASSSGTALAGDRSGEGPLVILVGGAFQHRVIEAATARLAVQVTVVRDDGCGGGGSGHRAPPAATPQLQGLGALTEPAASMMMVVVVGARSGVLAGGPWSTRHEAVLVADDRRPALAEGQVARLGELVAAGWRGVVVACVLTQAAGGPGQANPNRFRRQGQYWTVCSEGAVVLWGAEVLIPHAATSR
jgi:hypothetical protein